MMKTAACIVIYLVLNICAFHIKAQTITTFTPQKGPVGSLIKITGSNLNNPTTVIIGGVSAIVISNNGATIVAMVMPGSVSGTITISTAAGTTSTSSNFVIANPAIPTVQQSDKLVGTGVIGISSQGNAVSLSADGNTAIVGGYTDNSYQGAVWIYTRTNEKWDVGFKLTANDSIFRAQQGYSVALNADGNTAIVGGISDNTFQGAAWIFTKVNGVWLQQGKKLVGTNSVGNAQQGCSVGISADGNTAIVGGFSDNSNQGAAWIFTRTNGVWKQYGSKLFGTGAIGSAQQGNAVSISADGNTIAVGGNKDNNEQGAIWLYTKVDSVWKQQGNKLSGTGGIDTVQQGSSISLSANGNTLIVAGGKDNKGKGAAWVFTRNNNQWTQDGNKLINNDFNTDSVRLKFSVALNADGNLALVGGANNNGTKGAALLFTRDAGKWSPYKNQLAGVSNIPSTINGLAVGMSADASTIILGSTADNYGIGSANIFVKLPLPIISDFVPNKGAVGTLVKISGTNFKNLKSVIIGGVAALVISNTDTNLVAMVMPGAISGEVNITTVLGSVVGDNFLVIPTSYPSIQQGEKIIGVNGNTQFGYSVAISADGNTAVVGSKANVFVYKRSDGNWRQDANQLFDINSSNTQLAYSVAINADGNTVIVGANTDNSNQGAAWIFIKSSGSWVQQGNKLVGKRNIGAAQQGCSVAISADGNTAVIGGKFNNGGEGALWVFKRNVTVWTEEANLFAGGALGAAQLGYSIAISADGKTIVAGGNQDNNGKGAAWVFIKNENGWIQQGPKLKASDAISIISLGTSVSISADGNKIVVGGNKTETSGAGAIVFNRDINGWSTAGTPLIGATANNTIQLGKSVSISADGSTILVGAHLANNNKGAVWTFIKSVNGDWQELPTTLSGTNAIDNSFFGSSIALSADANTAIIGAPGDNTIGTTTIFRAASTNANLNALTISSGALSTSFSSLKTTYSSSVSKNIDSIAFTPTTIDTAALVEVKVNGANKLLIKSGVLTNKFPLKFGTNTIEIIVTAEDRLSINTYFLTITRFNQTVIALGNLNSFGSCAGNISSPQNIKVSGSGLSENMVITVSAGFEISTKIDSGFTSNIRLTQQDGIVDTTIIFVRMIAGIAGTNSGNIIVSSNDATSQNISLSGTINPLPSINPLIGVQQICIGNATKFSNDYLGGVWSSRYDSIATVNTEGLITSVKVGTTPIFYSVINTNGCKTIVSRDVTVNGVPAVSAITGIQQTCKDGSTVFANTTGGGVWSSSNNLVASIINAGLVAQVNGINEGTATIAYTVNNVQGCITKVERDVTVFSKPLIPPIIGASSVCTNATILLSNPISGGVWSVDSINVATIDQNGMLSPQKQGNSNVKYTVNSPAGCIANVNKTITISNTPDKPIITLEANSNLISSSAIGNYWYKTLNNTPNIINGATGKAFIPLLNGRYQVRINNEGCWSDFSNEFVFITTPITMLYPNPVNSFVIAQLESENIKRIILQLVDNLGNVIESKPTLLTIGKNEIRFNTEKLTKGSYYIAIKNYPSSSKLFIK